MSYGFSVPFVGGNEKRQAFACRLGLGRVFGCRAVGSCSLFVDYSEQLVYDVYDVIRVDIFKLGEVVFGEMDWSYLVDHRRSRLSG